MRSKVFWVLSSLKLLARLPRLAIEPFLFRVLIDFSPFLEFDFGEMKDSLNFFFRPM